MENRIRVFLMDEHMLFREALKCLLTTEGVHVLGEAGTATEGVREVLRLSPDVVLTGLTFPDFDGIEAAAQISAGRSDIRVVAVTGHPERLYLLRFLAAGGAGYVLKTASAAELLDAIRQAAQGKVYLSAAGVQLVAESVRPAPPPPVPVEPEGAEPLPTVLSEREFQVLGLLSRGYSSKEIGERLYLSSNTVESYKRRVIEKLQTNTKADLVAYAIRHKILGE